MVDTNCLVLMGTVYNRPYVQINQNGAIRCTFFLEYRFKNKAFVFEVIAKDELARCFRNQLFRGATVRLAGMLVQDQGYTYIQAEHLEVKENSNTFTTGEGI